MLLPILVLFSVLFNVNCFNLSNPQNELSPEFYLEKLQDNLRSGFVSNECMEAYFLLWDNITLFIDAGVKLPIPNGLLNGNFYDLGNFDECYGFERAIKSKTYYGKYCIGTIPIPGMATKSSYNEARLKLEQISSTPRVLGNDASQTGLHSAYCTPHVCSGDDLHFIIPFLKSNFDEQFCYSKAQEKELSSGAIATISIVAVFVGISLCSTFYDIYLYYHAKKPLHKTCIAFSYLTNGRKLLTPLTNPEQLLCLNGIKAISMCWVILGHEYVLLISTAIGNFFEELTFINSKENMWILVATLSVDTFFCVGGLVTMYTFLKSVDKGDSFNIPLYYIHRYIRLTPALVIVTLFHLFLFDYFGNGPYWFTVKKTLVDECRKWWWSGLLYIQNYTFSQCVPQTLYLSVDIQLFFLSPLVLYPIKKWPRIGYNILAFLILSGFVVPFIMTYIYELPGFFISMDMLDMVKMQNYMKYYYKATYTRFGPYVIGLAFGLLIFKIKKAKWQLAKTKKNILIAMALWIVAFGGLWACLYAGADIMISEYNKVSMSFYNSINRNAWAFLIGLVVLLCTSGFGGFIDTFLSLPIFQFTTKLSYCMYLVHYSFITIRLAANRNVTFLTNFLVMHTFWGDYVFNLILSLLLYLTFESPIIILEKSLFSGCRSSKPKLTPESPQSE